MEKELENRLKTIVAEAVDKAFANAKRNMLTEMARVGVMANKYDVIVYTDDMGYIPHVHVVDKSTGGHEFNCCVCLDKPEYFVHGSHVDKFNSKLKKDFNNFMHEPSKNPRFKNNYDYAVSMWNDNNSDAYIQIREDENGNVIVPDYIKL